MDSRDDAVVAHRETVRVFARPGGPLAPDSPYATMNNPAWFVDGLPTFERDSLHDRLIAAYKAAHPDARGEHRAIVLAGPPGAGKSMVLDEELAGDEPGWLRIDADEFKRALLREAIADGSYESFIKPEQVKAHEAGGEPFYPLELASLVHEESALLADRLRHEAIAEGTNVVIDTVLSNPAKAEELGALLARAGYAVEVIDVEVPFELSAVRIADRWRESYETAFDGDGLGGRWVPSEYAREVFAGAHGRSRPEESAARLAQTCPAVMRYRVFRTLTPETDRVLEVDLGRIQRGGALVDHKLVETMRTARAGTERTRTNRPGPGRSPRGPGVGQ